MSANSANDTPQVPCTYLRTLVATVEQGQRDVDEFLASEGLSREALATRDYVPADLFGRLYKRGMRLLDNEALGMVSARPVPTGTFRLMCLSMISCQTIGEIMDRADEFFDVFDVACIKPVAVPEGDAVRVTFGTPRRRDVAETQRVLANSEPVVIRTSLYYWYNLLGWFAGRALSLRNVDFAFPEGPGGYDWRTLYNAPVVFDAETSGLVMPRRVLSLPNVQSEQTLAEFLQETPYRLVVPSFVPPTLQDRLRALFAQMPGDTPPTSEEIASRVGMSVSTLRRKLSAEGVSWQSLKEEGRRTAALRFVADTDLPIAEISRLLGFEEASTFFRAFRRWTGTTPTRYRASVSNGEPVDD